MEELHFNNVFDVIGPIMIGPSSSHTAGTTRIGKVVRSILRQQPDSVDIYLYESFIKTYRGHGIDITLVSGLLDMEPGDEQLSNSLEIAYGQGMEVCFIPKSERADHPNSVKIVVSSGSQKLSVTGISVGGGSIQIFELNGFKLSLGVGTLALIAVHQNVSDMIAKVTNIPLASGTNISIMTITQEPKGEKAIVVTEADQVEVGDIVVQLAEIPHICSVNYFG